jgi:hypothetical protein
VLIWLYDFIFYTKILKSVILVDYYCSPQSFLSIHILLSFTPTMGFGSGISRAERKAKKRKLENSIPDVPEDLETESANEEITSAKRKRDSHDGADGSAEQDAKKSERIEKSDREAKRTKVNSTDAPSSSIPTGDQEASLLDDENAPKKSKKERKAERKAREAAAAAAAAATPETLAATTTPEQNAPDKASRVESAKTKAGTSVRKKQKVTDPKPEGKAARFIVFIGKAEFLNFVAVHPIDGGVREPAIHSNDSIYTKALCSRQTIIYTSPDGEGQCIQVEGLCFSRV